MMENHIKVNNKYSFNESNAIVTKKFKKTIVDTRSDKKLNKLKVEIFQSTCQKNTDASGSNLPIVQRDKCCITNIFVKAIRKKNYQALQ